MQMCGVISEHTKKMCTKSQRCPQHTDEQRRNVRAFLLRDSTYALVPLTIGFLSLSYIELTISCASPCILLICWTCHAVIIFQSAQIFVYPRIYEGSSSSANIHFFCRLDLWHQRICRIFPIQKRWFRNWVPSWIRRCGAIAGMKEHWLLPMTLPIWINHRCHSTRLTEVAILLKTWCSFNTDYRWYGNTEH